MKICFHLKFDSFGWTRLRLLYSSVLFTVLIVEKEKVVAKLPNLSKSIIYSAVKFILLSANKQYILQTIIAELLLFKTGTNSTQKPIGVILYYWLKSLKRLFLRNNFQVSENQSMFCLINFWTRRALYNCNPPLIVST